MVTCEDLGPSKEAPSHVVKEAPLSHVHKEEPVLNKDFLERMQQMLQAYESSAAGTMRSPKARID